MLKGRIRKKRKRNKKEREKEVILEKIDLKSLKENLKEIKKINNSHKVDSRKFLNLSLNNNNFNNKVILTLCSLQLKAGKQIFLTAIISLLMLITMKVKKEKLIKNMQRNRTEIRRKREEKARKEGIKIEGINKIGVIEEIETGKEKEIEEIEKGKEIEGIEIEVIGIEVIEGIGIEIEIEKRKDMTIENNNNYLIIIEKNMVNIFILNKLNIYKFNYGR